MNDKYIFEIQFWGIITMIIVLITLFMEKL